MYLVTCRAIVRSECYIAPCCSDPSDLSSRTCTTAEAHNNDDGTRRILVEEHAKEATWGLGVELRLVNPGEADGIMRG